MCGFAHRMLFGSACAVSAALVAPALAAAATDVSVSSSGKTLEVVAKNNATNNVVVSAMPTHLVVTDSSAGVDTSDPLCAKASPIVSCPIGLITTIEIKLGNRNDAAAISTTPGSAVPASINASIDGGTGNDALFGGLAADKLRGSANSDLLVGGDGADDLGGGSGDDLLDGGVGGDLMRGGSGTDTVSYATRTTGVSATIGGPAHQSGNAEDGAPAAGDTIDKDVENLIGSSGGDLLVGDGDANVLSGGAGADFLLGGAGSDRLVGGGSDDFIAGDVGDDILKGGSGSDVLKGGGGNDRLRARDGTADQKLRCGPGFDRVRRDKRLDPRAKGCELPAHRRHRRHHR